MAGQLVLIIDTIINRAVQEAQLLLRKSRSYGVVWNRSAVPYADHGYSKRGYVGGSLVYSRHMVLVYTLPMVSTSVAQEVGSLRG